MFNQKDEKYPGSVKENHFSFLFYLILSLFFFLVFFPVSVKASDHEVDTVYLGKPEHVRWETNTTGTWSSVKKASLYQVKLYVSDTVDIDSEDFTFDDLEEEEAECVMATKTSERTVDFSEYMVDGHTYIFAVRAIPKVNQQAYYVAGSWVVSGEVDAYSARIAGINEGMWRNYLEGSKYQMDDGSYLGEGWHLIQSNYYYMDENGYRKTGFLTDQDQTYYLKENGQLVTGWFQVGEEWYYSNESGVMQTGWVQSKPGYYYYLNSDGHMLKNCYQDGYWLDSSGLRTEVFSENTESAEPVVIAGQKTKESF